MKNSTYYSITAILVLQALVYTILSFGSIIDLFSYLIYHSQPDLTFLSFLALLPSSDLGNITSLWSVVLSFLGGLTFLTLAYLYGFKSDLGRIWVIFAIATFLWFGGESYWFYYVYTNSNLPPNVTIADFSWILGYPFFIGGLLLLNRQIGLETKKKTFNLFTVIMAVISIIILYELGTAIYTPDTSFFDATVYYAYVIGDLVVLYLAGLIILKFSGGGEIRRSYFFLILAFFFTALADILYAFDSYIFGIYQTYAFDIADSLYIIGYTLLIIGPLTYYYLVSKVLAD